MMKILAVSQYYPPDITACAFRIHDMVDCLRRNGHGVTVLTARPHKAQVDGDANHAQAADAMRTPLIKIGQGGLARYVAHYLSFVLGSCWLGLSLWLKRRKFDVVWVSSPPLFTGLSGLFLSRLLNCPLVLEIRDIWPDTAVAAGQLSEGGTGYRVGRRLELLLYKKADRIVCVSKPMQQYVEALTDVPVSVIYNGVSVPANAEKERREEESDEVKGPRVLLYAGNLGLLQELDLLIRAFAQLRDNNRMQDWRIRLIGAGPEAENLRALVRELDLEGEVTVEPPMSREKVVALSGKVAALFVSLKHHPVLARTIPSKVFDCLLAGRPILACLSGEGVEILNHTGANLTCQPGDLERLKAMLLQAEERYEELEERAPANRALVLQRFTREKGTDALMEIFGEVVGDPAVEEKLSRAAAV